MIATSDSSMPSYSRKLCFRKSSAERCAGGVPARLAGSVFKGVEAAVDMVGAVGFGGRGSARQAVQCAVTIARMIFSWLASAVGISATKRPSLIT